VAELTKKERAGLPDRAFAYVDSQGHRRVPIHDEAHVRNALARFDRVAFEDDAAEERARRRLLNAAKKYRIVPVGFVTGQVRKLRSRSSGVEGLPTGSVTFLETAGVNVSLRSFGRIDTCGDEGVGGRSQFEDFEGSSGLGSDFRSRGEPSTAGARPGWLVSARAPG
jgi:hypothetical protein